MSSPVPPTSRPQSPAAYWPGGRIVAALAIAVLAVLLIVLSGGANTINVTLPPDVPAKETFSGDGGSADLDGMHHCGLAAGTVLTTPGHSADRVQVDLASGVGSFGLQREG